MLEKSKRIKILVFLLFPILLNLLSSCSPSSKEILIASTTSLIDFGLVDRIIPLFEKNYNFKLTVISVGSGQALEMARRGKVDAIFSHIPQEEDRLLKEGFGISRIPFAFNYFILVGPPENPAKIEKGESLKSAFKKIYNSKALFISRGDNSGTHFKELEIWKLAGIRPGKEKWYLELGVGMGQALITASEKSAYTISDMTTFLKMKNNLNLKIITEDREHKNIYSLIILRGTEGEKVSTLEKFILSEDFKKIISECGIVDGEKTLFPYEFEKGF